uniref:Uncharacterized protein n=1 Tax=Anguilla anguilla TaxID=7936 RepID=A0A0E9QTU8_ANGAN
MGSCSASQGCRRTKQ